MTSVTRVLVVALLLIVPALIFWLLLLIQAARAMHLCPAGCWCNIIWNNVVCKSESLQHVTAGFHKDIRVLSLDDDNLTTLRRDIFLSSGLTRLHKLRADNCGIVNVLPGAFNGLSGLSLLSLKKNKIRELKSGSFSNLTTLQVLYLCENVIEVLESDVFVDVPKLRDLSLDGNGILHLNPDVFMSLAYIKTLSLRNNHRIIVPLDRPFVKAPTLMKLHISNCNIGTVSSITFSNSSALEVLDLSGNNLTGVDVEICAVVPQLKTLLLHDNPLDCNCGLLEVWRWCQDFNITTLSKRDGRAPKCCTPDEVSDLSWNVLQYSQCLSGNISYRKAYKSVTQEYNGIDNQFTEYYNFLKYDQTVVYAILFIFGAAGNFILVTAIVCNQEMRTVPNMYILHLALSDLMSLTVNLPLYHYVLLLKTWNYGLFLCKFYTFVRQLSIGLSVYSVAVLSIQRYLITVRSLSKSINSSSSRRETLTTLLGVWIVTSAFSLPSAFSVHLGKRCSHHLNITYYERVVIFELLVFCIIPLCVIVFMYAMTARHLVQSSLPLSGDTRHPRADVRVGIAKIVLGLTLVFIISYVPYHILWTYMMWNMLHLERVLWYSWFVSTCLLVLNSCLNPVALCCSSAAFRNVFKRYLLCSCKRKTFSASTSSSLSNTEL